MSDTIRAGVVYLVLRDVERNCCRPRRKTWEWIISELPVTQPEPKNRRTIRISYSTLLGTRASGGSWNACKGQRQNSNVIVLSKSLCLSGNRLCRLDAERS